MENSKAVIIVDEKDQDTQKITSLLSNYKVKYIAHGV